jgi:hypothetical protein
MEEQPLIDSTVPEPLGPQPSGIGLVRGFLGTAKTVLLNPRTFFQAMPVDGGLLGPYFFFLLCTVLFFLVSLAMVWAAQGSLDMRLFPGLLLALGMPFVTATLLHVFLAKLFGTGGSYEASFRVVCYASAVNLVAWIPIVGLISPFYEIYLSTLGLSLVHRTTMGRALSSVICTALTILLVVIMAGQTFLMF